MPTQIYQRPINTYVLGSIGHHNVAIACLANGSYGTTSATSMALRMVMTFRSICIHLVWMGIVAGVPCHGPNDVRLGDIVPCNDHSDTTKLEVRRKRENDVPVVHYGKLRPGTSSGIQGLSIEMEIAGLMDDFPCIQRPRNHSIHPEGQFNLKAFLQQLARKRDDFDSWATKQGPGTHDMGKAPGYPFVTKSEIEGRI
ncbi:hypothetical protein TSTA_032700 [Talaromyces stipitatus ATCC 10500]|uniref:Nucleoside phosphorylase domain-containing protein n=1 Tax=Talaromyces stipitatus (strain ATCC 10500 / CBS 375.48 / QM 6759 / NRRL 1006) TaxID=441959 RepID=B8M855_TALSN|nr:uncharacterized protein TSTA_032700 [Talaromyces stipitatus ATCC 10500]EED20017.1 hypothetical protein TSTA_032700 [Talaromyces stipitatus ATCC 10500]